MHGRQDDTQAVGVEHHRDVCGAGQVREQVGVAAPGQAGLVERGLVDRAGRDCIDPPRQRIGRGAADDVAAARPAAADMTPGSKAAGAPSTSGP